MLAVLLAQADPDFYQPLRFVPERGAEFTPTEVPDDWTSNDMDIWTVWRPPRRHGVEQGWKIHVSARLDQAASVLDRAAAVFFAGGVPFKHLSCARFFLSLHHKHADRAQAGKFCAAYPPDAATAERVMRELAEVLAGVEGPAILTDRRFGDSAVVHYRYGAYVGRTRIRLDGTHEPLVRDGNGVDTLDRRANSFQLPDGMTDPFVDADRMGDLAPVPADFTPVLHGYAIERVITPSNGGGAYLAHEVATGRPVFIKEARAHNGWSSYRTSARDRLRAEHELLRAVHDRHPGTCPEPLDYFRMWTNEFLVTELVPGTPLRRWVVSRLPIIQSRPTREAFERYFDQCLAIIDSVAAALDRIHESGYAYVDLNPNNVLIDDDGNARLVDFDAAVPLETAHPAETIGAPGHVPPRHIVFDDRRDYDEYGLSTLALSLIAPLNETAERNPAVLAHLRHELQRRGVLPRRLWHIATGFWRAAVHDVSHTPEPQEVARDPDHHLAALRDSLIAGLLAVADPAAPEHIFPLGPAAHATNPLGFAHGAAGVIHALARAGATLPDGLIERLARDALDQASALPPGLHTGLAGLAWVLADLGRLDEAVKLVEIADQHPLLQDAGVDSATLGHGRAGVALTHLALHRHTGEAHHLDRAVALAAANGDDTGELTGQLGPDDAVGLLRGRTGVALLHLYLGRDTGDTDHLRRGLSLLHADLARGHELDGGLLLPVSQRDNRMMPYLQSGSGGLTFVASRYLSLVEDERLTLALPALLASATCSFTVYGGLYSGLAGLGLVLAEHAQRHRDPAARQEATLAAARMFLYAVPRTGGTYILGEHTMRLSTDLSHGSAGVLLFLDHHLHQRPDPFLTLDGPDAGPTDGPTRREAHGRRPSEEVVAT